MKKVMIAVTSLTGGGAERVVSVWANQLTESGYPVSLLIYNRAENEYPVNPDVQIRTIAESYKKYKELGYGKRLRIMRRILKEECPDVLISFLPRMQIWMMAASLGQKMRRIETVRVSPWEICRNNRAEHFLWMLCYRRADAAVFQTAEQGEYFSEKIRRKSVVIPNPISPRYRDNPKSNYADSVRHFVAAGRITEQKNYPAMIEAFRTAHRKCPEIRLSIYGTGNESYMEQIQQMIDRYGLSSSITMHGRTADMLPVLHQADAFLMTSDFEGMPNALAEAMAVGLPCISTNCRTGPRDLIDSGENGYLVPVGDAEQIAGAILRLAETDSVRAEEIGRKARQKVLDLCSETNSLKRLITLIES